jgi:hypothetical protein
LLQGKIDGPNGFTDAQRDLGLWQVRESYLAKLTNPYKCLLQKSMIQSNVIVAVDAFTGWTRPWEFYERTKAHALLSNDDRAELAEIWNEVCKADHWRHPLLLQGAAAADQSLIARFPWLPSQTRAQLLNAASYQWR